MIWSYRCSFHKVEPYRHALRDLKPVPTTFELTVAMELHNHLIELGYMRSVFNSYGMLKLQDRSETTKLGSARVIWGRMDYKDTSYRANQVPIFLNLFKRQPSSRECIVCMEDKYEIDIESWDQWLRDCENFSGAWVWNVFEYPNSHIQLCKHSLDVCRNCMENHIKAALESTPCDKIECPQCDRVLLPSEIERLSTPETFQK